MRIGFISTMTGGPWGGSEELWAMTAQRALAEGNDVSICLPLRSRPAHKKFSDLESAGAEVFCHSDSCMYVRARQFARVLGMANRKLAGCLRERLSPLRAFFATRPDVVLISEGWSIPALEVIEAVERYHAPKPHLILSQSNGGEFLATEHRRRAAAFYRNARLALFVAESNWHATERQLAQRLVNARVVRNPVNLVSIEPVAWPHEQSINFASVARLHAMTKGQDLLLEVLSAPQWHARDWHLSLYGAGDDEAYFRELAEFYGLGERVRFCGQTRDIRKVWQGHHALVLPSRIEGTPLAMVEAMLCGRPVIGTYVAGIPEWVRAGQSGFLADAPLVKCLAATLETAWQQREHWQAMGNQAREDALRLYDSTPDHTLLSLVAEAANVRTSSRPLARAALLYPLGRL